MDDGLSRVAFAGGTGFTGRRVAARLEGKVGTLVCLVRPTSDRSVLPERARAVEGDLEDATTLASWLDGCSALVYTASMGFGHVPAVVAAAEAAGVRRAIFVSTTAIFTRLPAPSKSVRTAAEDAVRASTLDWTIVRPTMIYGAPGDRNIERLVRMVAGRPFVPVPGTGAHLIQPVHVDDLADGIVSAFLYDAAVRREYALSGAAPLSLNAAIDAVAAAVGKRPLRLHAPLRPVAACLGLTERLGVRLPIKREQVLRLAEDKAFDHDAATRDFGYAPRGFVEGVAEEARLLGFGGEVGA